MPSLLQINTTVSIGSTGRIADEIGKIAKESGFESWIAYGRGESGSASRLIRIGNNLDMYFHGVCTRLFDNHGHSLNSKVATIKFINQIKKINPNVIHLHNIHGYYINFPLLFKFLKEWGGPVVWTLHDCWAFTGHCSHYSYIGCNKWMSECFNCPQKRNYPSSILMDNSKSNFHNKIESFCGLRNLTIVAVSEWLKGEISKSFLACYPTITIHNGVDTDVFRPIKTQMQKKKKKSLELQTCGMIEKG